MRPVLGSSGAWRRLHASTGGCRRSRAKRYRRKVRCRSGSARCSCAWPGLALGDLDGSAARASFWFAIATGRCGMPPIGSRAATRRNPSCSLRRRSLAARLWPHAGRRIGPAVWRHRLAWLVVCTRLAPNPWLAFVCVLLFGPASRSTIRGPDRPCAGVTRRRGRAVAWPGTGLRSLLDRCRRIHRRPWGAACSSGDARSRYRAVLIFSIWPLGAPMVDAPEAERYFEPWRQLGRSTRRLAAASRTSLGDAQPSLVRLAAVAVRSLDDLRMAPFPAPAAHCVPRWWWPRACCLLLHVPDATGSEGVLMPLVPPLVVLAVFGAYLAKRASENTIDWFAIARSLSWRSSSGPTSSRRAFRLTAEDGGFDRRLSRTSTPL